MTFQEYLEYAVAYRKVHVDERYGQAFMNALGLCNVELSNRLLDDRDYDIYNCWDNQRNFRRFIVYVSSNWDDNNRQNQYFEFFDAR